MLIIQCYSVLIFVLFDCRTWSGPAWSPAQSLSSVLISIQSLLNEKPYHNEPGFEQVCKVLHKYNLKMFTIIVSAHPYCACKFTCHVMHQCLR